MRFPWLRGAEQIELPLSRYEILNWLEVAQPPHSRPREPKSSQKLLPTNARSAALAVRSMRNITHHPGPSSS